MKSLSFCVRYGRCARIAIVSVAYVWIFADQDGDVMFGVFRPVGLLILVAIIVTFGITSLPEPQHKT